MSYECLYFLDAPQQAKQWQRKGKKTTEKQQAYIIHRQYTSVHNTPNFPHS